MVGLQTPDKIVFLKNFGTLCPAEFMVERCFSVILAVQKVLIASVEYKLQSSYGACFKPNEITISQIYVDRIVFVLLVT
jgi:hypothetical protein